MKKSGIGLAVIPAMLWSALSVAGGSSTECVEYGYAGGEKILKCTPSPSAEKRDSGPDDPYWTKERLEGALPYPGPVRGGPGPFRAPSHLDAPSAPPGFDLGNPPADKPAPQPDGGMIPQIPVDPASGVETTVTRQLAAVPKKTEQIGIPMHSTFSVPRVLYAPPTPLYPYLAVGKIFFSTPGGDFVCSGSSIGGRAVLTAGHCVMEKGKAHTNWVFIPNYYNGERPFGTWSQTDAFVFKSWAEQENLGRDVAFSVVANQQGSTLSAKVGALGFAWNRPRTLLWAMFGYPAGAPYSGFEMIETLAPAAVIQDEVDGQKADPPTTGAGSIQTGGSSGGPWISDFSPGLQVSNFANGVNSYGYPGIDVMFSPYFDDAVKAMKDNAVAQ